MVTTMSEVKIEMLIVSGNDSNDEALATKRRICGEGQNDQKLSHSLTMTMSGLSAMYCGKNLDKENPILVSKNKNLQ